MSKIINLDGILNAKAETYERIIEFQNTCLIDSSKDITITFRNCKFICPNLLTVIGALPLLGERYNKKISLNLETINDSNLRACMTCSGFIDYLFPNVGKDMVTKNAVKFIQFNLDEIDNNTKILAYIYSIIDLIPVSMDIQVKNALAGNLYEIFHNAFKHSNSDIGLFGCGYYFPDNQVLYFSLYDAGVGIPKNVRDYLSNPKLKPEETLEWAFTKGHSTAKDRDYHGGLGFDIIKDFVVLNGGDASLYSYDAKASISPDGVHFTEINKTLLGTIFSIRIKSDRDKIYVMV